MIPQDTGVAIALALIIFLSSIQDTAEADNDSPLSLILSIHGLQFATLLRRSGLAQRKAGTCSPPIRKFNAAPDEAHVLLILPRPNDAFPSKSRNGRGYYFRVSFHARLTLAFVHKAAKSRVQQVARCLQASRYTRWRTCLSPALSDNTPALISGDAPRQHAVKRVPPVEFIHEPQIFEDVKFVGAIRSEIAIGVPSVEDARFLNAAVGAPLQDLKAEFQISHQSVCRVCDNSFGSGPPNHQIRGASNRIRHSAQTEINHSVAGMDPRK